MGHLLDEKELCFRQDRRLTFSASVWYRTSWNLTTFQLIRTIFIPRRKNVFLIFSEWAKILRGFTKSWIKQMLKITNFYLDKQKSFIPKKIWLAMIVLIWTERLYRSFPNIYGTDLNIPIPSCVVCFLHKGFLKSWRMLKRRK